MGFYFFNASELLKIECPLQPVDGGRCPQQSTRKGCPFEHRSAAVEAAVSRRHLVPMPAHICIDHFLTEGKCSRPQSSARMGDRLFCWCSAGFHPQNRTALELIRRGQEQGQIRVNEVGCCPMNSSGDLQALPPSTPPPIWTMLSSRRTSLPPAVDADDLVEDLDLEQNNQNNVLVDPREDDGGDNIAGNVQRSGFHFVDKCISGLFCFFVLLLIVLLLVKPA